MEFQACTTDETIEARLIGRLEFTDHDLLPNLVEMMNKPGLRSYIVELSGLDFIDSAGLGMLLILQEEAEQRNIRMVVRGARDDVKRSLDLARIGDILAIEY